MDTFGEWLREQRIARRLTRQEFADRVGCSVAMLRKIEDGERRPSAQIAELIANSLGVPAENRGTFLKAARGELSTERLPATAQPLSTANHPSVSPPRVNLPLLPMPLIGRKNEVSELQTILQNPGCRILTVTGPGGIGKTRLAIEAAAQSEGNFPDGVYFVPLASIQTGRFLVPLIADSIGFRFQAESLLEPRSQLLHYLSEKQALLVFDNLEHLLNEDTVLDLFLHILEQAANVKMLCTSRESLGLHGEWIFEVHGLPIPDDEKMEGTAVELFLQRARRAHVGFDATTEDFPAIVRICHLVEGMPLGIELAAAWVRSLSCEEIAREIERSLDFLGVSARDLPARHRSLRAVFDHSWTLLSEDEQNVLLRLSVFQGGFPRQAAQQVAEATLPTLSTLVTKSLVRRAASGRYDLHELIRQYALEQLAGQPSLQQEARARHAHYFMTFLCEQDLPLRSATQREALASLLADMENIRGALEWALTHEEFALIERSLRAYSTLFDTLGWAQEALEYLGRVRELLESRLSLSRTEQVALAHVLTARSLFAYRAAQHEQARVMLQRSRELLSSLQEPRIEVEALTFLGIITLIGGDMAGAATLFEEGLQLARDIDDQWYTALLLTEVVGVNTLMGAVDDAHAQFESAVQAWRRTGDRRFTAFGLNYLSLGAMAAGKYDEARTALEESVQINREVGDRWGLGISYRGLGLVAQAQQDHSSALESFHESLEIFRELGSHWDAARVLSEIAQSTLALGNESDAEQLWRTSLQLSADTHGALTTMEALVGLATLHAARAEYRQALPLLLLSIREAAVIADTRHRATKMADHLKEKLTAEEIDSAQRFAREHSVDAVVQQVLAGSYQP